VAIIRLFRDNKEDGQTYDTGYRTPPGQRILPSSTRIQQLQNLECAYSQKPVRVRHEKRKTHVATQKHSHTAGSI